MQQRATRLAKTLIGLSITSGIAITGGRVDTATQLVGITRDGQVVEINIETGAATPLFHIDEGGPLAYDPVSRQLVVKLNDDASSELVFVEPVSGIATDPVPVTGLPPEFENVSTIGFAGEGGRYVLPAGPTGTVFEDRLVLVDASGAVIDVSEALGLVDNDGVVWDDLNARLIVHDYNASDGFPPVAAVEDPFGTPVITALADPPSRGDVGDSAIDPETGRLFTTGYDASGGFLVEVFTSGYVDIGPFGTSEQIIGIAFVGGIACPADLDADGDLTIFDFLAFQNAFDAGCP